MKKTKLWIDLANSPHVPFFAPIVRELERRGVGVLLTARDFAQTLGLCRLHGLLVEPVGVHGGRGTLAKARAILARAAALRKVGRRERPDLAASHNSYAQALAARSLGIPTVTLMDYEHTPANHVNFRLAHRVLLPSAIEPAEVRRYGAIPSKLVRYDGFKEQVYLEELEPDRSVLHPALPEDLWDRNVVAVARPPADFAIYHRFANPLFEQWLQRVGRDPAMRIVVLPRTPDQRQRLRSLDLPSVIVPDVDVLGANLLYHADLVVSAGGTMNREAAVLGVPAYSLFAGRPAAVDHALERLGRLTFVRSEADLGKIRPGERRNIGRLRNPGLCSRITDLILDGLSLKSPRPAGRPMGRRA